MNSLSRLQLAYTLTKKSGRNFEPGKSFLSNVATGVAWGIGGTAVDKGVNALSHAFNKRKKPKPDIDQESHEPKSK